MNNIIWSEIYEDLIFLYFENDIKVLNAEQFFNCLEIFDENKYK